MVQTQSIKDADKLIDFFNNIKSRYLSYGVDKGLISFCLDILNVNSFNLADVEDALKDLRSICLIISRDITGDKLIEFNNITKNGIDRIDAWLHSVYSRVIPADDEDLFFSDDVVDTSVLRSVSRKTLTDDYFDMTTEYTGMVTLPSIVGYQEGDLTNQEVEPIVVYKNGATVIFENDIPWTDRNKVWVGDKHLLETRLNAKYRKAKDKRLIKIMTELYEQLGDEILFKTIVIEDGALNSKGSYSFEIDKEHSDKYLTIRKK